MVSGFLFYSAKKLCDKTFVMLLLNQLTKKSVILLIENRRPTSQKLAGVGRVVDQSTNGLTTPPRLPEET
jgi:hypothetical protein